MLKWWITFKNRRKPSKYSAWNRKVATDSVFDKKRIGKYEQLVKNDWWLFLAKKIGMGLEQWTYVGKD